MQPGDVPITYADSEALEKDYGFRPQIPLRDTLRGYCEWHYQYYGPAKEEDLSTVSTATTDDGRKQGNEK